MSLQRILRPYRLFLPDSLKETFGDSQSFTNKARVIAFVKAAQKIDPTFNPLIRTEHYVYECTTTGKRYRSRNDYSREQESAGKWRADQEAKRSEQLLEWRLKQSTIDHNSKLVPTESYLAERGYR